MNRINYWCPSALALAAMLGVLICGCGPDIDRVESGGAGTPPTTDGPDAGGPTRVEAPPDEPVDKPSPPTIPEVKLTESLRETNVVGVGERLPAAELPDLQGQPRELDALLAPRLTVVVFFDVGNPYGTMELEDLEKGFVESVAEKGVAVVAVAVGDTAQEVREAVQPMNLSFPVLLDTENRLFDQVATDHLPRTYLVDSSGKILWFDLEYSSTTRRQLDRAVEAALLEKEPGEQAAN